MELKYTSFEWAKATLPKRKTDGNKGSFGRLFMYVGSEKYQGASHLALESALRGGAGYVEVGASGEVKRNLLLKFPEVIYKDFLEADKLSDSDVDALTFASSLAGVTLVGCGSGKSVRLMYLIERLLSVESGVLVLDADAINSMAEDREKMLKILKESQRGVVLTPHPLEFSRLSGLDVQYINDNRIDCAKAFAGEYGCTLVLKGKGTVITDGDKVYVNTSGSSALAKAGSGDTLSGLLSSLLLSSSLSNVEASAIAAFVHGMAGDNLSKEYSEYGVTPSDLPKEMARALSSIEKR